MTENQNFKIYLKIFALISGIFVIYGDDLILVFRAAINNESSSHILAIPFLLAYLIYRVKSVIYASIKYEERSIKLFNLILIKDVFGLMLCALGLFFRIYGSYTFFPLEYHILSMPIYTLGLVLLIFNIQTTRTLLFSVMFLVLLIPPPYNLTQTIGGFLSVISSIVSYWITKLAGLPVILTYDYISPIILLETKSGEMISLAIDLACSGMYSLIGFLIFSFFVSYISRVPIIKKIVVLGFGFPLIYSLNILRITIIVFIAYFFGPTLALNLFHFFGGWILIFIGALSLFFLSEKIFKIHLFEKTSLVCSHINTTSENICCDCGRLLRYPDINVSKYEYIKILSLILIIMLVTSIQVPVFVFSDRGAEISLVGSDASSQISILPIIEDYELEFSHRDEEFEIISGQDASLMYVYTPLNGSKSPVWVGVEIGETRASLHPWEACLIIYPTFHEVEVQVTQLGLRDIHINSNPPLPARYFSFYWNRTYDAEVILYWYIASNFITSEGFQEKIAKISVIRFPVQPNKYLDAEDEIYPIAEKIVEYWAPTKEWTQTALFIASSGPMLILLLSVTIITLTIYIYIIRMKNKLNKNSILSILKDPIDIKLMDILSSKLIDPITISEIRNKMEEISVLNVNDRIINDKLKQAEDRNIIKRKIVNINDEPYISWEM
jgi:exosortase/archaeosortase family protein